MCCSLSPHAEKNIMLGIDHLLKDPHFHLKIGISIIIRKINSFLRVSNNKKEYRENKPSHNAFIVPHFSSHFINKDNAKNKKAKVKSVSYVVSVVNLF